MEIVFFSLTLVGALFAMRRLLSQAHPSGLRQEQAQLQSSPRYMSYMMEIPYGVFEWLQAGGFLEYVRRNVDKIVYNENLRTGGCARLDLPYPPKVIEIKPKSLGHQMGRQDLAKITADIAMASTIVHEAAHWEQWILHRRTGERYPEKKAIEFVKSLKPFLRGNPFKLNVPGGYGSIWSITIDQSKLDFSNSRYGILRD